jgi:hypothetical protein
MSEQTTNEEMFIERIHTSDSNQVTLRDKLQLHGCAIRQRPNSEPADRSHRRRISAQGKDFVPLWH